MIISAAGRYRPQEVESAAARPALLTILSSSSEEEIPLPRLRAATFGGATLEGNLSLGDSPDADTALPTLEEGASQRLQSPIGTKEPEFVNDSEQDSLKTFDAPPPRPRASTTSLAYDPLRKEVWKRNLGDFDNILLTGYMKTGTISIRVIYDPDLDIIMDHTEKIYPREVRPTTLQLASYLKDIAELPLPPLKKLDFDNILLTGYMNHQYPSIYDPDLDIIVDHTEKIYPREVRPTTLQLASYLKDIAELPLPPLKMIVGIVCLKRHDQVRWIDSRKQWMNVESGQKVLGFRAPKFDDLQRSGLFKSPQKLRS
jgi:hypothetical protein